jgi:hypothetical protein
MNSERGRQQTTLGIWAACAPKGSLLVLDVEGTDSKERAEEGFERKSSLFSLAMAEVLLVNMWYSDIGRFTASNYALLRMVFEINLQLFARAEGPRTTLLFVIRDHLTETEGGQALSVLEGQLRGDMDRIWGEIKKPAQFARSAVGDFFDFRFVGLAHYMYKRADFNDGVASLRERLVDQASPGYLFQPECSKAVPADGIPAYVAQIWKVIMENKDLDIPTQKEMLATFRCDEISGEVAEAFAEEVGPWRDGDAGKAGPGKARALGEALGRALASAMASFDGRTESYHQEVVKRKRAVLAERLHSDLLPVYRSHLAAQRALAFSAFRSEVETSLPRDPARAARGFAAATAQASKRALADFAAAAREANPAFEQTGPWPSADAEEELADSVRALVHAERKAQLEALNAEVKRRTTEVLDEDLQGLLIAATSAKDKAETLWKDVQGAYDAGRAAVEGELASVLAGDYAASPEEVAAFAARIDAEAVVELRRVCVAASAQLVVRMRTRFERLFKLDADGIPRIWQPTDDIRAAFVAARDEVTPLVNLFAEIRVTPARATLDPKVLSEKKKAEIVAAFTQEIEASFVDARNAQEARNRPLNIPYWMYAVIAFLGWNEFWAFVTSPVLMLSVIVGSVFLLSGYGEQLGIPHVALATSILRSTIKSIIDALDKLTAQPQQQTQQPAPKATEDAHEKKEKKARKDD